MKLIGIIAGILLTLSGGYCLFHPGVTFMSLGWLIGVLILIHGIGSICAWIQAKKLKAATVWELLSAVLTVVVGVLILINVNARLFTDMTLIILIGVWLAISGVLRITWSIKSKPSWWGLSLAWGIVLILAALASLIHPAVAVVSMGYCIAFALITQGINLLIFACSMAKSKEEK